MGRLDPLGVDRPRPTSGRRLVSPSAIFILPTVDVDIMTRQHAHHILRLASPRA